MNPAGKTATRMTKQRHMIIELLKRNRGAHPTADWIYEQVRRQLPNVSLGTVYRNLNLLKSTGQILELCYGNAQSRFDGDTRKHYHFVCRRCGRIYDIAFPVSNAVEEKAREMGFSVEGSRMEVYGLCSPCQVTPGTTCFEIRGCTYNNFLDERCPQREFKNCWESEKTCPRLPECSKRCEECALSLP